LSKVLRELLHQHKLSLAFTLTVWHEFDTLQKGVEKARVQAETTGFQK
jgi:hypothetical protein